MDDEPKIGGKPPKWMGKIMENPIEMDDLGCFPPIFGNTHIQLFNFSSCIVCFYHMSFSSDLGLVLKVVAQCLRNIMESRN